MKDCALVEPALEPVDRRPTPQALWLRYHQHADGHTENALVEQYLPLVRSVLGRLAMGLPDHVGQEDLNSAGLVGLLQALRNYNPASGTPFESYARQRIRGAMLDELRRMDWVPRSVHEKARRLQEAIVQLEQQLGRIPADAEVARALKLSPTQYSELLDAVRPATFVCLDAACTADQEGNRFADVIADPEEEGPQERTSREELKQLVLRRLKALPENQRKVLALYYMEDLHLREIAEVLGVTESRVCQIHSQAILSIRAYLQRLEATP